MLKEIRLAALKKKLRQAAFEVAREAFLEIIF